MQKIYSIYLRFTPRQTQQKAQRQVDIVPPNILDVLKERGLNMAFQMALSRFRLQDHLALTHDFPCHTANDREGIATAPTLRV